MRKVDLEKLWRKKSNLATEILATMMFSSWARWTDIAIAMGHNVVTMTTFSNTCFVSLNRKRWRPYFSLQFLWRRLILGHFLTHPISFYRTTQISKNAPYFRRCISGHTPTHTQVGPFRVMPYCLVYFISEMHLQKLPVVTFP